jgi:MFS family permease
MRGTLGSLNQLMICLGILAALVVNVALPVTSWRTMFMLAAVPAALLFLGKMQTIPHTPWILLCVAQQHALFLTMYDTPAAA